MKLTVCVILSVLMLFAVYSKTKANSPLANIGYCQGVEDINCPQLLCSLKGLIGWKIQDNSKPYPECCGGPICA